MLSVYAFLGERRQWETPELNQHWTGWETAETSSTPAVSQPEINERIEQFIKQSLPSGGHGSVHGAKPNGSNLPDACLSGLPGLAEGDALTENMQAEVEEVRKLIEANALALNNAKPTASHQVAAQNLPEANREQAFQPESGSFYPQTSAAAITSNTPADPSYGGAFQGQASVVPSVTPETGNHQDVQSVNFENYNPHVKTTAARTDISHQPQEYSPQDPNCYDPHADIYQENKFPSATQCAKCHEQIFDEWASSSHAYAAISPMFQKFEQKINTLAQGTLGYFCLRCHAPVATTVGLRRDQPIWDGPRVFREGVTCIACHRVKEVNTKTNGERRIEPGDIYDPVYSGSGQLGSQIVAKYADYFKVKTSPEDKRPGQPIHQRAIQFEEISKSDFCMSCHQVAVQPGIKLEVVWDQYRASPAYRDGIQCQECHMGIVPGRAEGYSIGPAAVVDGKAVTPERKHSNHMFFGPGYSIAHPGTFPHNVKADRWSVNDWLEFDWRAGWGTDDFEDAVADGKFNPHFPPAWAEPDDRYDAREIIEENLKKLGYKKDVRRQVMENGSKLDGPFFQHEPSAGQALRFHYCVQNTNPGHNMPSGSLGAQPQLWLNVVLIGPDGQRIWETGNLDSHGDLLDLHSQDVLDRIRPLDKQLFNLQTKFLTTNVKGTDREMYLPINVDFDQLPFIRPAPQPVTVLNHPPFIRMEGHSIPPLGMRKAKYVIPAQLMGQPGTYRLSVRLRSRAEPIYFMKFVDATPEMIRMMNEWIVDAHVQSVVFEVR